jgi:hypothetical protein
MEKLHGTKIIDNKKSLEGAVQYKENELKKWSGMNL